MKPSDAARGELHIEQSTANTRPLLKQAAVVFAVALILRVIYSLQAARCPLFRAPTIDAFAYFDLARQFAHGEWLNPVGKPYWQPPFYSMALAMWIKLVGPSVVMAKAAQFAVGSINCGLIYALGCRVFDRRVGLIAGIAAACYGPLIYYDGELLTPTLQICLNLSAILILLSAARTRSLACFAAAGLVLGLSIILRPDAALFAAAVVVWSAFALRGEPARRIASVCVVFAVCAALPTVPLAVRNRVVGKDAVLISSNGGINFYIGNNPDEERTRAIRPGPDWDAMQALPKKDLPHGKPSEQSAWFYRKGLEFAAGHPVDYAKLIARKSMMYISAVEGRRNHDLYFYRGYSSLYSALVFKVGGFALPFGLVLPLAVFGLLACKRTRETRLLMLYLVTGFVVTVAFFVCARYRVTAVPVFLIFAAAGGVELARVIRARSVRAAALPLCAAVCALVISNLNLCGIDRNQRIIDADTHFYMAGILASEADPACLREYETSIRLNPSYEPARYNYSEVLAGLGRFAEQERQLILCVKMNPRSPAANARLGEIRERRGNLEEAVSGYIVAARADSHFVGKLVGAAEKAYARKDYPLAVRALRGVVDVRPKWAEARRSLGVALMKLGRLDESIEQLRLACKLDPGSADALIALGLAYHRAGDAAREREAFENARRIGPGPEVNERIEDALGRL